MHAPGGTLSVSPTQLKENRRILAVRFPATEQKLCKLIYCTQGSQLPGVNPHRRTWWKPAASGLSEPLTQSSSRDTTVPSWAMEQRPSLLSWSANLDHLFAHGPIPETRPGYGLICLGGTGLGEESTMVFNSKSLLIYHHMEEILPNNLV